MSITMLQSEVMGKGYERKRIPGKGELKLRCCLGGCGKKFKTTIETRICQQCKRQNSDRDDSTAFSVNYFKSWKDE